METILCNGVCQASSVLETVNLGVFKRRIIPKLPFKKVISNGFGQFLFYELQWPGYTILYRLFNIMKDSSIIISGEKGSPGIFVNHGDSLMVNMSKGNRSKASKYWYCLENTAMNTLELNLKKNGQYAFMNVYFPLNILTHPPHPPINHPSLINFFNNSNNTTRDFKMASPPMIRESMKILDHYDYFPTEELYLESIICALALQAIDHFLKAHSQHYRIVTGGLHDPINRNLN